MRCATVPFCRRNNFGDSLRVFIVAAVGQQTGNGERFYLNYSQINLYYFKQLIIIYSRKCAPYVRLLANNSSRFIPDVSLVLLLKLFPFRELPHEL